MPDVSSVAAEHASPATTAGGAADTWSNRIKVEKVGKSATVSGTDRSRDPKELREALKAHGFNWKPKQEIWRHERPHKARRDDAVDAIRALLSRLDEQTRAPAYPPTPQQQAILDACAAGQSVAVRALAGTGKTSTMRMLAALCPI